MNNEEMVKEFAEILDILSSHAHLKYSGNYAGYDLKISAATAAFLSLIHRRTGMLLPSDDIFLPIDEERTVSLEGIHHLMKRVVLRYKSMANEYKKGSKERALLLRYSEEWERARTMF